MRRRQVYAEIEQRKADAQMAVLAGALDSVTAFDPENYRVIVDATPSKPAPALPVGPVAPVMRRRQLLPLQGDGPDGQAPGLHVRPPFVPPAPFMAEQSRPGFCPKCNKHIGRAAAFHRKRCQG